MLWYSALLAQLSGRFLQPKTMNSCGCSVCVLLVPVCIRGSLAESNKPFKRGSGPLQEEQDVRDLGFAKFLQK